jgi:hypothetical protein
MFTPHPISSHFIWQQSVFRRGVGCLSSLLSHRRARSAVKHHLRPSPSSRSSFTLWWCQVHPLLRRRVLESYWSIYLLAFLCDSISSIRTIASLHAGMEYSRFGQSIIMSDVNKDGFDDLIVAAPLYSVFRNPDHGSPPYLSFPLPCTFLSPTSSFLLANWVLRIFLNSGMVWIYTQMEALRNQVIEKCEDHANFRAVGPVSFNSDIFIFVCSNVLTAWSFILECWRKVRWDHDYRWCQSRWQVWVIDCSNSSKSSHRYGYTLKLQDIEVCLTSMHIWSCRNGRGSAFIFGSESIIWICIQISRV